MPVAAGVVPVARQHHRCGTAETPASVRIRGEDLCQVQPVVVTPVRLATLPEQLATGVQLLGTAADGGQAALQQRVNPPS